MSGAMEAEGESASESTSSDDEADNQSVENQAGDLYSGDEMAGSDHDFAAIPALEEADEGGALGSLRGGGGNDSPIEIRDGDLFPMTEFATVYEGLNRGVTWTVFPQQLATCLSAAVDLAKNGDDSLCVRVPTFFFKTARCFLFSCLVPTLHFLFISWPPQTTAARRYTPRAARPRASR